jgi:hypothetical protein
MCMRITTGGAGEVCIAIVLTVSVTRTAVRQVCTECDSGMEERRQWFSRSLHLWQQDRRQRDAVVIAENHDPPETLLPNRSYAQEYPNLELVAFKHNKTVAIELCERETPFVGEHELIALNVARQRSQRIRNATHVVMISGRYYIPSLLDMIAERLTRSTDIITMATVGMGAGCSIMGCRNNVSDVTATSVLTDWARSHPKGPTRRLCATCCGGAPSFRTIVRTRYVSACPDLSEIIRTEYSIFRRCTTRTRGQDLTGTTGIPLRLDAFGSRFVSLSGVARTRRTNPSVPRSRRGSTAVFS